ncbi:hypothetical protein [Arthrobacter agilis]|uniref:hypothetical protein n=1 Tax=Arthrobacter agilis TaxID=37921 RepID=UPI00278B7832|nr:hypothetical protein [Arthrobacter agilis]MDQ0737087.1 hypothetical protein [Arthrobacter agilis]
MADDPRTDAATGGESGQHSALTAWTSALDALERILDTLEAAADTAGDTTSESTADSAADTSADSAAAPTAGTAEATAGDPEFLRRTAASVDWTPPQVDGPIPASLVPRARRIRERQQAVLTRLTGDAETLRRHQSAIGSVRAATAPLQSSIYLDVTG